MPRLLFPNPSEVDCSFFLVTVDLWSADARHEMNLVLHPTSADRYVPSNTPKVKRRGTGASTTSANQRAARQNSAPPPTPTSSQYPPVRIPFPSFVLSLLSLTRTVQWYGNDSVHDTYFPSIWPTRFSFPTSSKSLRTRVQYLPANCTLWSPS